MPPSAGHGPGPGPAPGRLGNGVVTAQIRVVHAAAIAVVAMVAGTVGGLMGFQVAGNAPWPILDLTGFAGAATAASAVYVGGVLKARSEGPPIVPLSRDLERFL